MSVGAGLRAGQFGGEQIADAEQTRLQFERRSLRRKPAGALFGEMLHRPRVVFVAESAENSLPQRLLPANLPRAGGDVRGLGLKTDLRCLMEKFGEFFRRKFAQRRTALTAQIFRQGFGGF